MSSEILHQRPDLVRVSGVLHDVLHNGQDPGRVHPQRVGHADAVDLNRLELVEVEKDLRVPVKKFLKI